VTGRPRRFWTWAASLVATQARHRCSRPEIAWRTTVTGGGSGGDGRHGPAAGPLLTSGARAAFWWVLVGGGGGTGTLVDFQHPPSSRLELTDAGCSPRFVPLPCVYLPASCCVETPLESLARETLDRCLFLPPLSLDHLSNPHSATTSGAGSRRLSLARLSTGESGRGPCACDRDWAPQTTRTQKDPSVLALCLVEPDIPLSRPFNLRHWPTKASPRQRPTKHDDTTNSELPCPSLRP
jgi:hypothetical protein